jgi:hypothetical protein
VFTEEAKGMVLDKAVGEGIGSDIARCRDRENIEPE